jgi:hypothetical protein
LASREPASGHHCREIETLKSQLLVSTYEEVSLRPRAIQRLAGLLMKLAATLNEVRRQGTAELQAGLLALAPAHRRYAFVDRRSRRSGRSRAVDCYAGRGGFQIGTNFEAWTFNQRRWATRDEARRDLFAYIEGYYNRQRIHSALGYLTPEQAERTAS